MHEFSQIDFLIGGENRRFTLKSAIYSSNITFSKRASGYGFSGDALTFTTRLMDAANIKDRNILSLTESQSSNIHTLVQLPLAPQKFEFKNMPSQNGYLADIFLNLDLTQSEAQLENTIYYFKSNLHIIQLLTGLYTATNSDLILNALLKINVRVATPEIIQTWTNMIQNITALNISASQMAQLITLGKNLVPDTQWTPEATQALLQIPRNIEGRINASIIEVLMNKDSRALKPNEQGSFKIANDLSGRTQSNILVFQALNNLENNIFNEFIVMIKSTDANISKSGIYGACQVIEYYKLKNPAALETFKSYRTLLDLLLRIKKSEKIKLSDRLQERLQSL
jgi:hypothetical protein